MQLVESTYPNTKIFPSSETLYRPLIPHPVKVLCYSAMSDLFKYLPLSRDHPENVEYRQWLQIASWMSLWPTKLQKYRFVVDTVMGDIHVLTRYQRARSLACVRTQTWCYVQHPAWNHIGQWNDMIALCMIVYAFLSALPLPRRSS